MKYLVSRSGHTFRIFTTRLATSSSPAAVFKLNKKCKSVKLPPLLRTGTRPEGQQEKSLSGTQQSHKRKYLMGYDMACRGALGKESHGERAMVSPNRQRHLQAQDEDESEAGPDNMLLKKLLKRLKWGDHCK